MINLSDKSECCGCGACAQKCPKSCIDMIQDVEGYLYPAINADLCVNCGICNIVCPIINQATIREPIEVLGAKNTNIDIVQESSSGGIFCSIALKFIRGGGIVYGAKYDEDWNVVHSKAESINELFFLLGSKYVQSDICSIYCEIENQLKSGREVLFSGTPCQSVALSNFLSKKYDNLTIVDLICHGVPSPGMWQKYIKETKEKYGMSKITKINFRDKKLGWRNYSVTIQGLTKKDRFKQISLIHWKNPFFKAFHSGILLRPSCYSCPAKKGKSKSDLTLGDYWGVWHSNTNFYNEKGVSVVMVNTVKGRILFESLTDIVTIPISYTEICEYNNSHIISSLKNPNRKRIIEKLISGASFHTIFHVPLYVRGYYKIMNIIKRALL